MSLFLMVMAVEILILLCRVSGHFIWPLEEWFILNLLKNLMDQLSKHCINRLSVDRPYLSYIIPSWPIVIISVRPEIPSLLRDHLTLPFPFPLLLVVFDPFVLIDSVH